MHADSNILERAHLAYTRGQFAEACAMLEPLIAAEPGNSAASDLLARAIAAQVSDSYRQKNRFAWRRTSSPVWQLGGFVAIVVIILVSNYWPDPKNERVATGLVENAYQVAVTGASEEPYFHHQWIAIERDYGRVVRWRITSVHRSFPTHGWEFEVAVTRERAETREQVEAMAGPSRSYGYYSSVTDVRVERARPRSIYP